MNDYRWKGQSDTVAMYNIDKYSGDYCDGNDENLYMPSLEFDLIDIDFNDLDNTIKTLKSSNSYYSYIDPNSSLIYVLY